MTGGSPGHGTWEPGVGAGGKDSQSITGQQWESPLLGQGGGQRQPEREVSCHQRAAPAPP